jgi:hypothetical protein
MWKSAWALAVLAATHPAVISADRATVELLTGNKSEMLRLGLQSPTGFILALSSESNFSLAWQYSLAYWRQNRPANDFSRFESLFDIGLTPVIRWNALSSKGLFAQVGIGAHWLSKRYDNNDREFSTHLQFMSHLAGGYAFQDRFTAALVVAHVSNGGIKKPNPGVNFMGIQLGKQY